MQPSRSRAPAFPPRKGGVLTKTRRADGMSNVLPVSYRQHTFGAEPAPGHHQRRPRRTDRCQMLLRKEVIQPHLPVRLPCYDLVLITDPTFDGSLHKG